MANLDLLVIEGGKQKRKASSAQAIDFLSLRLGADNLEIVQSGSGGAAYFDLGARNARSTANAQVAADLTNKAYVDQLFAQVASALEWQDSVIDRVTAPPGSPVVGGRYLIDGLLGAATGDFAGQENKIATWDGSAWSYVSPTTGMFVSADDEADVVYYYGGSGWNAKAFENTTASTGLEKVGTDIRVAFEAANPTLENAGGKLKVKYGTAAALEQGADGLAVKTKATGALAKSNDGLEVKTEASNPSLQIDGSNQLGLKMDPAGALSKVAGGVKANTDGDSLKIASNALAVDHAKSKTNDNVAQITVRQVVFVKPNGNVDLAQANVVGLDESELGIVEDATIEPAAAGKVIFRRGAIIPGFTGLTPGKKQYVSAVAAGALVEDLTGHSAGDQVYCVGRALSATELVYDPQYEYEY